MEFEVLETNTRMLNKAKETASLPVLTPTSRTAYASVLIVWMINVKTKTSGIGLVNM